MDLSVADGTLSLSTTAGLSFTSGDGTDDASMTFRGSASEINAALDGLVYDPGIDFSGSDTLSIQVDDLGNLGGGGPLTTSQSVNISVTGVNDAPAIVVPGTQTTNEDTSLVFNDSNSNRITVSDADAGPQDLEVQLSVPDGTFTLSQTTGLTFSIGDGTDDSAMRFQGTATEINAALDGLIFDPAQDFEGSVSLTISVDDLGNTGAGGAKTAIANLTVNVNSVNDAPAIQSLLGDELNYTEGDGALVIDQGVGAVASDFDSTDFNGGSLTVSFSAGGQSSEDVLAIRNEGTGPGQIGTSGSDVLFQGTTFGSFSGGTNGDPLLIAFSNANADAGSVTALLRNITYSNTGGDDPTAGNRTVEFALDDGDGGGTASVAATVSVTAVNDMPFVLNIAGDTLSYDEGDGTQTLDQNTAATVFDLDSPDFDSGTLTVSVMSGGVPAEDVLSIRNQGTGAGQIGVSGSDVTFEGMVIGAFTGGAAGADLIITFNDSSSPEAVTALIRNLTYENVNTDNPTAGARMLRSTLTDGDGAMTGWNNTVDVHAINDAPSVTVPGGQTVMQDSSLSISGISIADVDAGSADVTLTLEVSNGTITLDVSAPGGVNAGDIAGNGTGMATVQGSLAEINATLSEGVVYLNAMGFSGVDSLSVTVNDEGHSGDGPPAELEATDTVEINVTANQAPIVAGIEGSPLTFTENGSPLLVTQTLTVSDVDSPLLTGATVSISAGFESGEDELTVDTSGTSVSLVGFNTMTGVMTLSGNDSPAAYQQVLRTIRYQNASELPSTATRTVSFVVTDGFSTSVAVSRDIAVTSVDDAPQFVGGQPTSATINEHRTNPAPIFTVMVDDVDSAPIDLTFEIVTGNTGNAFAINSAGEITVNNSAAIDFESSPVFTLEVEVVDETMLSDSQNFTINLNDLVEDFEITPAAFSGGRVTLVRDGAMLRAVDDFGDDLVAPAAVASVLNVSVTGRNEGSDELRVDFSGGIPAPEGMIIYDGGTSTDTMGGGSFSDSLSLVGGAATQVEHTFANATAGNVDVDGFGIAYTGLEPIFDDLNADDRVFLFGGANDSVQVLDDGTPGNSIMRIQSAGTSETVDFRVPSNSLQIATGAGDDSVTLATVDSLFNPSQATIVATGTGSDMVDASAFVIDGQFTSPDLHLAGGAENDTLIAGGGDDLLEGEGGSDELFGGAGSNTLRGGAGDDTLTHALFEGTDTARGGSGDDTLVLVYDDRFSPPPEAVTYEFTAAADGQFTGEADLEGDPVSDIVDFTGIDEVQEAFGAAQTTADYSALNAPLTLTLSQTGSEIFEDETSIAVLGAPDLFLSSVPGVLEVLGGTGADQFSVVTLPSGFDAGLTFNGGNGSDQFVLSGGLPAGGINDDLDITAETIQLDGNIDANSNTIRLNGLVSFAGSTTLTASLVEFGQGVVLDPGNPLAINGSVDVDGAQLQLVDSTAPSLLDKPVLNNNGLDAVTGTFAGLPAGAVVTATVPAINGGGTRAFILTYTGGDGNDVVLQPTAAVTGIVWDDVNEDGIRQMGEPGVEGVNVSARLDATGMVLTSTVTASDGTYTLAGLPAADVYVEFDPPVGDRFTLRDVGPDDTIDSDPHRLTGRTDPFSLSAGETFDSVDAGLARVLVSIHDVEPVNEGRSGETTTLEFEITLSGRSPRPVEVTAQAFEGTDGQELGLATLGTDFLQFSGGSATVTFQPGQTSQVVRLPVLGDDDIEADEAFEVRLTGVANGAVDDDTASVVITNDDVDTPTVELVANPSVIERNFPDRPQLEFEVRLLGGPSNQDILVSYETVAGAAPMGVPEATPATTLSPPDGDYLPITGVVRIPAGQSSAIIRVAVISDNLIEADEVVPLQLTGVTSEGGAPVELGAVTSTLGTIVNDDVLLPTVSIGDAEVVEMNAPFEPAMRFPVTLDGPSDQAVTIEFSSVILQGPGTATAFVDFQPRFDGVLVIPAGQVSGFIDIPVFGDQDIEPDEVIAVELQDVTNGMLGEALGVGTIVNDDVAVPCGSPRRPAQ
ncbi:MAG: SdrD B-like domain-containing protein [Planctomycetota bacterium]